MIYMIIAGYFEGDLCRSDNAMTIATVLMNLIVTSGTMTIKVTY